MKITPQHAERIMEAAQLREFGWTQQQIADDLNVRQGTISKWGKLWNIPTLPQRNNHLINIPSCKSLDIPKNPPICLFPCLYEEAAQHIEPGSRETTIELVDSKALVELPTDLKEQIERQCQKILKQLK